MLIDAFVPSCASTSLSIGGTLLGLNSDPSSIPEERVGLASSKTTPTDTDTDLSIWGGNWTKQIHLWRQVRDQESQQQLSGRHSPSSWIFLVLQSADRPTHHMHFGLAICLSFRPPVSISGPGAGKDKHSPPCCPVAAQTWVDVSLKYFRLWQWKPLTPPSVLPSIRPSLDSIGIPFWERSLWTEWMSWM